jgi:hypothetical protein
VRRRAASTVPASHASDDPATGLGALDAILEHHRISRYRGPHAWLVEPFRRADWMDVTGGLVASGLSRELFRAALARWPRAGFHRLLARLAWQHERRHPSDPLPMLKL